jgi:hypothetical protein
MFLLERIGTKRSEHPNRNQNSRTETKILLGLEWKPALSNNTPYHVTLQVPQFTIIFFWVSADPALGCQSL